MAHQFYSINISGNVSGAGIKERVPAKTISLTNQNLATNLVGTSVSGYTLVTGDRFILAGQTTGAENGIYVADTVSYRAEDYETGADCTNCFLTVTSGTYANTKWQAIGTGVVGTGTQGWVQIDIMAYTAGDIKYAATSTTQALLHAPSTTSILTMNSSGVPSWANPIGVSLGGTGLTSITSGNLLLGAGTSAISLLAPTAYRTLVSNGTPAFALSNTVYVDTVGGDTYGGTSATFTDTSTSVGTLAANYINFSNALAGASPLFTATGSDTNINMRFQATGTGTYNFQSTSAAAAELHFAQKNGTNYVGFRAPLAVTSSLAWTLPAADGTNGQFISTNGGGVLSFSSAPTNIVNTSLSPEPIIVSNRAQQSVAFFTYNVGRYGSAATCAVYFESVNGAAFNFIITNATATTTISTTTISSSGFQSITFTAPSVNSRLTFDVIKNASGTSPTIYGLQLSVN